MRDIDMDKNAGHENFDAWMENPYTKVLLKSIAEDHVPRAQLSTARAEGFEQAAQAVKALHATISDPLIIGAERAEAGHNTLDNAERAIRALQCPDQPANAAEALTQVALATPAAPEQKAAQPAAVLAAGIDMGCLKLNDACWAFVGAMPHQLPGPIWNDLKPAVKVAIEKYLAALPPAQPPAQSEQDRDAERYRFACEHGVILLLNKDGSGYSRSCTDKEEADAAIDAAMLAQKKESGNGE